MNPTSNDIRWDRGPRKEGAAKARVKVPLAPQPPKVCQIIIDSVPKAVKGIDRVRFLSEHVMALLDKDRAILRQHVEHYIKHMLKIGASDIDAGGSSSNGYIWYRVDGNKVPHKEMGKIEEDLADILLLNMLSESQIDLLFRRSAVDFSYQLFLEGKRDRRFRVTIYFDYGHLALNIRAIEDKLRTLSSLKFHPIIENGLMFRHIRDGLTLVTGVTGSGKSTTLDAIIDANNSDVNSHVVIIGNPIEYMHESKLCIIRHREVGRDVATFKDGVVQALRQDPDMIVIGEMRDPSTISAALEVTDSGHKVFSTLHTSSAVESIDRIIAEYPTDEQDRVRNRLADVLRCIISQKLCPKVGGGRILAKEILWMTPSTRAAIKNNNVGEIYQMMWEGGSQGQITMEQDLYRLMQQRFITPETAMHYSNNKRRFKQLIAGGG